MAHALAIRSLVILVAFYFATVSQLVAEETNPVSRKEAKAFQTSAKFLELLVSGRHGDVKQLLYLYVERGIFRQLARARQIVARKRPKIARLHIDGDEALAITSPCVDTDNNNNQGALAIKVVFLDGTWEILEVTFLSRDDLVEQEFEFHRGAPETKVIPHTSFEPEKQQPAKDDRLEKARKVINEITEWEAAPRFSGPDVYDDEARLKTFRIYPNGAVRQLDIGVAQLKKLSFIVNPLAIARGDRNRYSQVGFYNEADRIRVVAKRYSFLKRYEGLHMWVLAKNEQGEWRIVEEILESLAIPGTGG